MNVIKCSIFIILSVAITGCLEKQTNKKIQSLKKNNSPEVIEKTAISESSKEQITEKKKNEENKLEALNNIIQLNGAPNFYHEDTTYNLKKYWQKIDSTTFWNIKKAAVNNIDTSFLIQPINNILTIPTDIGNISYTTKPLNEYSYEHEEYNYTGYYKRFQAHVVSKSFAEGFGYDLILTSTGKKISLAGFPYLSNDNKLIVTCRIDEENMVLGTIQIYSSNPLKESIMWGGWSDYKLLPTEAVWESDNTILFMADHYPSEEDYFAERNVITTYGRLTIKNH